MKKALVLQLGAALISVLLFGVLFGERGAYSAAIAGGSCVLPNAFFVFRLESLSQRPGASYVANFFLGEFLKIATTIGLMAIAVKMYSEMHWPSLLVGFAIVLHAGFLAFWKKD